MGSCCKEGMQGAITIYALACVSGVIQIYYFTSESYTVLSKYVSDS